MAAKTPFPPRKPGAPHPSSLAAVLDRTAGRTTETYALTEGETGLPDQARKGRGAITNRPGRYEPGARPLEDDGWRNDTADEAERQATEVRIDASRSIINRNDSPDLPFTQSINPYRGCEHGCIYCYARPSHAYLGLSPGLDFESKLYAKPEAARLLARALCRPSYKPALIVLGSNTDPYQPIERRFAITRAILEVLAAFRHPVGIITKSANILRDRDILSAMAKDNLVKVHLSVTSLDPGLARVMEPRASTPHRRLEAIRELHAAGVPTGVSIAPVIPALNDAEIERIAAAAAEAGAESAHWTLLRLPLEIKDLFAEWLATHFPDRAQHVLKRIADCRAGLLYRGGPEARLSGARMSGTGPYAEILRQRFRLAVKKSGLNRKGWTAETGLFRIPAGIDGQLDLFG